MRRIVCFGDSNTYGQSPVDGSRYSEDIRWTGLLDKLLGEKFEVVNEGKSGRTIAFDDPYIEGCNGMADIVPCINANKPLELLVIMLGTNDLKVYFGATPQSIAGNLLEMCRLARENTDAKLLLVSPMLLGDQIEFSPLHLEFGREQVDYSFELAPQIERVAQEMGAEFIDLAVVAMSSDVDCLHLMPEEHAKIAQAMQTKIVSMFQEELEQEAREEEERKKRQEEELRKLRQEEELRLRQEEERRQLHQEEERTPFHQEEFIPQQQEEIGKSQEDEEEQSGIQFQELIRKVVGARPSQTETSDGLFAGSSEDDYGLEAAVIDNFKETEPVLETEKEKMLSGKLYRCDDKLGEEMAAAKKLTSAYNQTVSGEEEKRRQILQSLFQRMGQEVYVEPPFHCDYGSNISVGDYFYANFDCIMLDVARINIGNHVFLGPKVNIYTAGHPIYAPVRNECLEYGKEVTIGDDVWIGGNVTINPCVHIGSNVVIGSGSVVTADIPDGVVAAGNPCRVIRRISDSDRQYWEGKKAEYGLPYSEFR